MEAFDPVSLCASAEKSLAIGDTEMGGQVVNHLRQKLQRAEERPLIRVALQNSLEQMVA